MECEWAESGDLIMNDGPTIPHLIFKSINLDTSTSVSNLKYQIEKSNLAKFVNIVKDLLDDMYSNYSIIIDKVERHEDYVCHIFRVLLSGPNQNFNSFIEITKGG